MAMEGPWDLPDPTGPGGYKHNGHRRVHIHLGVEEVGAPSLSDEDLPARTPRPVAIAMEAAGVAFAVSDDRIEQAARAKFVAGGYTVLEDERHDIDIEYDGETYIVEAWVW